MVTTAATPGIATRVVAGAPAFSDMSETLFDTLNAYRPAEEPSRVVAVGKECPWCNWREPSERRFPSPIIGERNSTAKNRKQPIELAARIVANLRHIKLDLAQW